MDLLKTILVSVFAFIIVVLLLAFICVWRSKCPWTKTYSYAYTCIIYKNARIPCIIFFFSSFFKDKRI